MPEVAEQNSQESASTQQPTVQDQGAGSQTQTQATSADGGTVAARPDWLPEALWDASKNAPNIDELGKSFKELNDFKTAAEAAKAGLPESADKYEVALPAEFKMPEGWDIDPKSPAWKVGQEFAHKHGLSQAQFSDMAAAFIGAQVEMRNAETGALQNALKARDEALGANGAARVEALNNWFGAAFGEAVGKQFAQTLFTPEIVAGFEKIQQTLVSQGVSTFVQTGTAGRDDGKPENWDTMSAVDRRTWNLEQQRQQAGKR